MSASRSARARRYLPLAPLAAALWLAGCGGGSDAAAPTTVSGSVVKGPVNGAQVCVYAATASGKGTQLGCTTTGANGSYTLAVQATGDVIVEASGGNYTDEATNVSKPLSDPLQVVVAAGGNTQVTGVVTPLTSMAYSLTRSGGSVSASSFATAANQVAASLNLTGTNLATTVPTVTGTTDAYGRMLRAVSQYVANGGTLAGLVGVQSPATLQTALQTAYATINGSNITINLSGLTAGTGNAGGTTGGTTGATTGGTGGATAATGSLTIGFSASGLGAVSLPSVTVNGVSAPPAGTFCSGVSTADANLAALSALGTVTIGKCSGSGNVYTVDMTVATAGFTIPYTVTYTYN